MNWLRKMFFKLEVWRLMREANRIKLKQQAFKRQPTIDDN